MIKIDIISGFLGAGKTTLIKKLVAEAYKGQKIVLIENEFGEVGIDGGFMKEAGIEITEMNSGCICCSLVGDFSEALHKVIEQYAPDRIVIEPSGVGKLSDIERAVSGVLSDNVVINTRTVVADANKCKMYIKNFGEFYNNQVENATCIVLSRTGNMTEEKIADSLKLLKEHNDKAIIVTTPWDQLTGAQILDAMEDANKEVALADKLFDDDDDDDEECCCGHHHHHDDDDDDNEECCCGHHHHHHDDDDDDEECCCHHHDHDHEHHHHHHHGHDADEIFTSWGETTTNKYTVEEIEKILSEFDKDHAKCGQIVRSKGIVMAEGGKWIHFDYVPLEHNVRYGTQEVTGKICVIGAKLDEKLLAKLFRI